MIIPQHLQVCLKKSVIYFARKRRLKKEHYLTIRPHSCQRLNMFNKVYYGLSHGVVTWDVNFDCLLLVRR